MNREILFRGKTEPDGHWVYGSLISRRVFSGWLHWITYQELVDKKNELWLDCEARVRVKSETVGQYTGIKIGGQKLFEHDVIRYRETSSDDWQYGAVVWCGDRDYPAFDVEPWIDCDCNGLSYIVAECEAEIIGNRWDNPELLEVLGVNREIKFRGKRLDNGKWVFGDLLTKHPHHKGLTIVENGVLHHEVDPETVGQYTGLKDTNGVKIFEGDIVKQHYFEGCAGSNLGYSEVDAEIIGVVGRDFAGTYTVSADGVHYYWYDILEESEEQLEVIGDRWDNPELLGVD